MVTDTGLFDLVDLARYPLADLDGPEGRAVDRRRPVPTGRHRGGRAPGLPRPRRGGQAGGGRRGPGPPGPPLRGGGDGLPRVPRLRPPEDHPRLRFAPYAVAAVGYDVIPRTSPLRRLYEWDPMLELIAAILDRGPLYRYGDPFGALNLAVMADGDQLQWHFDQTDFVVSLAIQSAERGRGLRGGPPHPAAPTTSTTRRRGRGPGRRRRDGVVTLPMTPGTLLIFEGRHSLHRVSPVGGRPRCATSGSWPTTRSRGPWAATCCGWTATAGPCRSPIRRPLAPGPDVTGRHDPPAAGVGTQIGEAFVGSGPDAAHLNTVLGARGGPVESAWATALAMPRPGHVAFVCVCGPVWPSNRSPSSSTRRPWPVRTTND